MWKTGLRPIWGICIALLIIAFGLSPQIRSIYNFPEHMRVMEGEPALFAVSFPFTVSMNRKSEKNIHVLASSLYDSVFSRRAFLESVKMGQVFVQFKLFGVFPLRTVELDVLPQVKLFPGGQSIGVVLHSQGIIVVGSSPIKTENGQYVNPAREAGVHIGDVIMSVNGAPLQNEMELAEMIDENGQERRMMNMMIKRGEESFQISVLPVLCTETKRYRVGLFVRDSAAGVGTLTFYDPQSRTYGALGHVITDNDTNQPIDCAKGKIVLAPVAAIQYGRRGQPGEKVGVFLDGDEELGTISKNTQFGIFGKLNTIPTNNVYPEGVLAASMNQVQLGHAEMLTVIDGQSIERFNIDIERINLQESPRGKGLVIKVTDLRLLEKTGGIVQGMSGSPIIQNGKMIGAVTHVFVHDPTKGYGCFVDWMLMESGMIPRDERRSAHNLFSVRADFFLHFSRYSRALREEKNYLDFYGFFFHTREEMTQFCRIVFSE